MIIDATFWVAISFLIFVILLIYFKIPLKIKKLLDDNISQIRKQVDESENLKEEAKNKLAEHEKRIVGSKSEYDNISKTSAYYNLNWLTKNLNSNTGDLSYRQHKDYVLYLKNNSES